MFIIKIKIMPVIFPKMMICWLLRYSTEQKFSCAFDHVRYSLTNVVLKKKVYKN